jgi:acetyl-CoA synthetase (ADP-forming)
MPGDVRPALTANRLEALQRLPEGMLTVPEVRAVLEAYGVPVARERRAADAGGAASAAGELGYPVALKAVCRGLVHKRDAGVVHLGLADARAVVAAWERIASAVHRLAGVAWDGCVVQEIIAGEAEVIVGAHRDDQFGPVLLVGWGGSQVEVLNDVQMTLCPVTPARAVELLKALRIWPVLSGAGGRPPLDIDRIADIASRVSLLAADLGDRLIELDVNPIVVRTQGEGAVAVDCRATLGPDRPPGADMVEQRQAHEHGGVQ